MFREIEIGDIASIISGYVVSINQLDGIVETVNYILSEDLFDKATLEGIKDGLRLNISALPQNLRIAFLRCRSLLFRKRPNLFRLVLAQIDNFKQLMQIEDDNERQCVAFDRVSNIWESYGPRTFRIGNLKHSIHAHR